MDLVDSTSAAVFKRHFSERNAPGDLLCAIGLKRMDVCQMDDAVSAWHGIARHGSAPDCAKLCTVAVQLRKDERARETLPYPGKGKAWGCGVIDAPAFRVENGRLDGVKQPSRLGYVVPDWTGTPCCGDFNSLHSLWRDADFIRNSGAKICRGVPLEKNALRP